MIFVYMCTIWVPNSVVIKFSLVLDKDKSNSNNLFEMVDKADQAMDLEKALKNNEEINVESLVESDGETKLQHGMFLQWLNITKTLTI